MFGYGGYADPGPEVAAGIGFPADGGYGGYPPKLFDAAGGYGGNALFGAWYGKNEFPVGGLPPIAPAPGCGMYAKKTSSMY